MRHNDNAYATMLLTLSFSPSKEEIVRPYSAPEFHRLSDAMREISGQEIGRIINADISGVIRDAGLTEPEAYRVCLLANRSLTLSYALERYATDCIDIITPFDLEYPIRLSTRLADQAPPTFYACGHLPLLTKPIVAILGVQGFRQNQTMEQEVRALTRHILEEGFIVMTGGEQGVCRIAENETMKQGGKMISFLGGDLCARSSTEGYAEAIAEKRCLLLSLVHPDAPFTAAHATARSKALFALSHAAFIMTSDARHGELEAIKNRYCDWIYAYDWEKPEGNRYLIARGARPMTAVDDVPFSQYAQAWKLGSAIQMSFL